MRLRITIWMTASAVGAILLALPDRGDRLVNFSEAHGLTLVDGLGVAVLVAGWLPVAAAGWQRRNELMRSVDRSTASGGIFVAGVGVGLIVASAFVDFAGWWAVGALLLVLIQAAALLALAARRSS